MLVKNRAMGDSIMGLAAVQYLKQCFEKSTIIYAIPQWIAPLYSEAIISADSIYPLKLASFRDVLNLYKDIKKLKIDHIHEMHQSGRGAKVLKWICYLQKIRYTAHNHHLKSDTGVFDQGKILPLIQRDLDGLFSFLGKGERPQYLDFCPVVIPKEKMNKKAIIIMGVVATRATKMWPLSNYIKLAHLINDKHPHYFVVIPLSKSKEDTKIKEQICELGLPDNTSIVEWNLAQLPKQFEEASLYIGNDTGLKHLAVAVGLKTYTFFGPEPVNEWHPYDAKIHPYFYLEDLACRTRTHHYCGLNFCDLKDGFMHCLNSFNAETVFSSLEKDFLK